MKNITITITDSDGNVTFETSTKAKQQYWDDHVFGEGRKIIQPDDLVEAVSEEIRGKFYATNGDWFDKANHEQKAKHGFHTAGLHREFDRLDGE